MLAGSVLIEFIDVIENRPSNRSEGLPQLRSFRPARMEGMSELRLFTRLPLGLGFAPAIPFLDQLRQVGKSDRLAQLAIDTVTVVEVESGFS
jgi:hypothetical protein